MTDRMLEICVRKSTDARSETTWIRKSWLVQAGLVLLLGLTLAAPRAEAGSCDGFANYADELIASNFQLVNETSLGDGLSEVELSFDVANVDLGDFASASAYPELDEVASALGIEEVTTPAAFGALAPLAVASPTTHLRLRLPTDNVSALLAELGTGGLPLTVHADERDILAPGVRLVSWTSIEDAGYALARDTSSPPVNLDPGPPPYAPGAEFGIVLIVYGDGMSSVFDSFNPTETLYVVPDAYIPSEIPEVMHYARVIDVFKSDEDGSGTEASDGITTWIVSLARTDTELLPNLYTSASFCTGASTHIDLPVQATRLHTIDRATQEDESRDGRPQPIHFNDVDVDGLITLSGQLEGHVLRPSLEIRLRDGAVRAVVDIDTDLSFAAELRAQASWSSDKEIELYDLCFPLPDLVAGPVPIGLNLQLEHILFAAGNISAGAIVGIQKSYEAGFTVGFDGRRDPDDQFFSQPRHAQPTPVEFTPPQLLDDTGVTLSLSTEIVTTLRVGAKYPFCDTGAGAYLGARAAGSLEVFPTQDPWWRMGHSAQAFAGINLEILGLEIASHEAEVELFPGEETRESAGSLTLPGGTSGASAASSPMLSGEDQRWGYAIDTVGLPNGLRRSAVAELSDGRVVVMGEEKIGGRDQLIGLDRFGVLSWSAEYGGLHSPSEVIVLPDDTILVAGDPAWIARHDADGTLLASWDFTVTDTPADPLFCVVQGAAPIEEAPGVYGFVAVGHHGRNDVRQRDACAFRIDSLGSLVWAKTYGEDGSQDLFDVIVTSEGRVVAVGEAEIGPTPFSENNPLFVSLDAGDGSVIWTRSLPTLGRNSKLNAVVEAADGTLFAAGGGLRSITQTGAAMVARIDPDGENAYHALVMQDDVWESLIPAAGFEETDGGDTAYDEIFDLTPVSGGFLFAGSTGLGAAKAGWVGKINDGLGIEWFRTFDGDNADTLDGVAAADGGYLVSGFSQSLDRNLPETDTQLWLMKLAFEGGTDLRSSAGLRTRYVAPGVRASSEDDGVVPDAMVSMEVPLVVTDALATSTVTAIANLLDPPASLCVTRLSGSGRESEADACEPVPEPGMVMLLASGVVMLAGLGARRRK